MIHVKTPGTTAMILMAPSNWKHFERWNGTKLEQRGSEYDDEKNKAICNAEDLLYITHSNLATHLVNRKVFTCLSTQHWDGSPKGEIYNAVCNTNRLFDMYDKCIKTTGKVRKGLYIAGSDAMPITGIEMSAISGLIATSKVTDNWRIIGDYFLDKIK